MSKVKISKEAKKFREAYEIGNVWLPRIVNGLYMIRDMRCRNESIMVPEVQEMFNKLNFFISFNNEFPECDNISLGKGNNLYISINRYLSIIPSSPISVHSIVVGNGEKNYVQYVKRITPVFSLVNYKRVSVQLPESLDIVGLPEESLFQTELCIDSKLVQGAAVWMGLRDFGLKICQIDYYGDSLLKIKRLNSAVESVVCKLREKYKA